MNVDEFIGRRRRRRRADNWEEDNWDNDDEESWDMGDLHSEDFAEGFDDVKDFSVTTFYPDPYCKRVSQMKNACFHESLLELWANKGVFDQESDAAIAGLTKEGILNKINSQNERYGSNSILITLANIIFCSQLFLHEKDFIGMLSGVQRDVGGNIMAASATIVKWIGRMNATLAKTEPADDSGTRGELVDIATAQFEKDLAEVLLKYQTMEPLDVKVEVIENI